MTMPRGFSFELQTRPGGPAEPRVGRLRTPHGAVDTPAFIPVGTKATVKGVDPRTLAEIGVQIVLSNTYHLAVRPGADVVRALGGVHEMMGWQGPMLTDSGGFQVFSLADLRRVTDDGVTFQNHVDGAEMTLTPESAVALQAALGADVVMALDVCPPYPCSREEVEDAVRRTVAWAPRCREAMTRSDQALWAITQGGVERDLRERCTRELVAMDFPGYAVGGVSVGEGHENLVRVLDWSTPLLPTHKPRYLMGVGEPRDVVAAVGRGVDLFDCVLPTRNGRNASAFTFDGPIRLRNARYETDTAPIEADCDCPTCRRFGRGTLRHLFQAGEMMGPILVSVHNIRFFIRLMERLRGAIRDGCYCGTARGILDRYARTD